jgi:DNA-binding LacI/PurR family transcriptional regulator/DNA-binding FadR family transcriptional regulator
MAKWKKAISANACPGIQKAFEYVKENLDKRIWKPGEWLPTIKQLSLSSGVSRVTMRKAIVRLKQARLIHGNDRHRLKVGASEGAGEPIDCQLSPWHRLRIKVENDLIAGIFGLQGKLPVLKELQSRYGTCFRTMREILQALVTDGILEPSGKGYALPGIHSRAFKRRIVFVTCTGHFTQTSALNLEHNRIVNMFENECMRVALQFEIIEIDFYDSTDAHRALSKLVRSDLTAGYILDVWWWHNETYQRSYFEILDHLASLRNPVAILDEIGTFVLPVRHTRNPLLQVYTFEGKRAGERVARLLSGLGHRSVAYFSLVHNAPWSCDRYDGIAAHFSRAGHGDNVFLFSDEVHEGMLDLYATSGLGDRDVRKLIEAGHPASQVEDLYARWMKFDRNPAEQRIKNNPDFARQRKNLSGLAAILNQSLDANFIGRACNAILSEAGRLNGEIHSNRLFERALKEQKITAWVCATDKIAFEAISFLRRYKIRVPEDLSVIGFDNEPVTALEQRLTTLDFNAPGFILRMLGFILRPPRPRGPYRHSTIEVEGILMERDTTGGSRA